VDEHTVKWHFKRPWAGFLGIMQNVPGMPISAKALREDPQGVDTHPVGSGAYMLEDASPGNYLKVKRNPDWWFGKSIGRPDMPYFDGIIINVIPDPAVRLANLRAGKIDGMPVDPSQYDLVKDDPDLKVYVMPQNHVFGMAFNHTEGPCKDIRVRQAVSHAIDRKALIQGAMFGLGRLASCMYPGDHWTHNPDLEPVRYDPELSKKLLAEAGYKDGLTLEGMFGNLPLSVTLAEAIKGMLADVGIDWKVDLLDPAAISDRMKNIEYDLMGLLWTWIWDPDLMATGLYHPDGGFNYGRSRNEKAIALIAAGRKEVDFDKRQKIYFELEKVLYDNYEDVWVSWAMTVNAYRKNVMGWDNEKYLKGREGFWFSHPLWFKEGKP
jgi:peptide/nickel transport system substrate-binding protein